MDERLLKIYNQELKFLREMGGEFAREFPKIAARLGLDEFQCADPFVERLLEGFAFLAARTQLKLQAEFPRFTQSLLATVYPHYLAPTPSMAMVQFQPDLTDEGLAEGYEIPRGTSLHSILGPEDQTACEYRTAHEVTLWPIEIAETQYYIRNVGVLDLPEGCEARAALRIRIRSTAGLPLNEVKLDDLTLFLRGTTDEAGRLYEQFFARTTAVVFQPVERPVRWREVISGRPIERVGFKPEEALLPHDVRSFQGYRLLQEYFVFPARFSFVKLTGLGNAVPRCEGTELDIIVLFREADLTLESLIGPKDFVLFCTPVVNLFPMRADRIHLSDRFPEFHVVPDRTRPLDFEVYDVTGVTAYGTRPDEKQKFYPFYSTSDFDGSQPTRAYYTLNRVPRVATDRERRYGLLSKYPGSEVYVSLVDREEAPYRPGLRQLGIAALCTNRDLPLRLDVGHGETDFTLDISAPVESVQCLGQPVAPAPSYAEGETAWRLISHLSLNYLSLVDTDEREGAEAFRELLRLYCGAEKRNVLNQIAGISAVCSRPIVRRVFAPGPIAFARGLEVTVTFDEEAFAETGVAPLGAVLDHFFAGYVSLNSFTETVVRSASRGEVMRWPARLGQTQMV